MSPQSFSFWGFWGKNRHFQTCYKHVYLGLPYNRLYDLSPPTFSSSTVDDCLLWNKRNRAGKNSPQASFTRDMGSNKTPFHFILWKHRFSGLALQQQNSFPVTECICSRPYFHLNNGFSTFSGLDFDRVGEDYLLNNFLHIHISTETLQENFLQNFIIRCISNTLQKILI